MMIYFDTCVISGLAKGDLNPCQSKAALDLLRRFSGKKINIVTSEAARREIEEIPEEHRVPHEAIRVLLLEIPTAAYQRPPLMALLGVGGGAREDPTLTQLKALLRDETDAQHIFQAIKNDAAYFVTVDQRSILLKANELESKFGIQALQPDDLVRKLGQDPG